MSGACARPSPAAAPIGRIDVAEEELLRRAFSDPVTGLPSRALFLEELRGALACRPEARSVHAVMVVHVEMRHAVVPADDVLAEIAQRLGGFVRDGDTVARVGPFDFALLMGVRSAGDVGLVADRILDGVRWPLRGADPRPSVASIGVAVSPGGGEADLLLRAAEMAVGSVPGPACSDRHTEVAGGFHDDCP